MQDTQDTHLSNLQQNYSAQEMQVHELYMQRCLQLALNGKEQAKPNPMVGAVIVANNRIIGEGYHICFGKAHAEVNAFASVKPEDEHLLPQATLYVSLEPCSHHGKTPPCADLIIAKRVPRVVVGCKDPFKEVSGRGIKKLQDAGVEVLVGVLQQECLFVNRFFITAQQLKRPYIILKWAQTLNGFIDNHGKAIAISSPFTQMLVHKLRAECDAILVGNNTEKREQPQLNVRHWSGTSPKKYVLSSQTTPQEIVDFIYKEGAQSLMIEGGLQTHNTFIALNLWDEIHLEIAPITVGGGTPAPALPNDAILIDHETFDNRQTFVFVKQK